MPNPRLGLRVALIVAASLALPAAPGLVAQQDPEPAAPKSPPPLYDNLGGYHRKISASPRAQQYFDQGLRLVYAFNHDEAQRAFVEASRLDPSCAICHWGAALCLGPNINLPAMAGRATAAVREARAAARLAGKASPVERALIRALASRYSDPPPSDPAGQKKLDEAYASAMRDVAHRFPNDLDVQTLYAESMMDLRPWDFWSVEGEPRPGTEEIVRTLEHVLAKSPNHPGANHYYVHAVEASRKPDRALESAHRLETMMPDAGHLVHMPAHIYIRTGQYEEAAAANRRAIDADARYVAAAGPQTIYTMYVAHNHQFLWAAAMLEGKSAESIEAARNAVATVPIEMLKEMPGNDLVLNCPALALLRFGRWDDVMKEAAPPADFPYATAMWHYARGIAQAKLGNADAAALEKSEFERVAATVPEDARESLNSARDLLAVASRVIAGQIAAKTGDNATAVRELSAAVGWQDKLKYAEPPDWYYPVRQTLGAVLLGAGQAREAERVFREDLARTPHNGWSLAGLANALEAQGRDAASVRKEFDEAWREADIPLKASDF
jgi:tetratricopeptide (TPR) repeat protein